MIYKGLTEEQVTKLRDYLLTRPAGEVYELLLILDTAISVKTEQEKKEPVEYAVI